MDRRLRVAAFILAVFTVRSASADVRRVGDVIPDGTVRFQTGSQDLTAASEAILDRLATFLKRRPELALVLIIGHADDRGTEAVNERLSLGRAKTVRSALVSRGLAASRLKVEGAGSREPLTTEQTEAAHARNRRVEVWVTPPGSVARLSRIERKVEAREPAAPEWRRAQQNQALRRMSRVRTLERSASEIKFPKDDRVTMGPNALAVIYGSPTATRRSRRSTADVELQGGSLFAALAEREGRMIDVEARSGRINVRSKKTRVNADSLRRQATIEVYDGESTVSSEGKRVNVARGYGTRVRDNKPPDPPRRLPQAPRWTSAETLFQLENEPLALAWVPAPKTVAAELQLGLGNDIDVERPVRLDRVEGSSVAASALAGVYVARLAGIDDIGLVGPSGPPRPVVVLPTPQLARSGAALTRARPGAPLQVPAPGTVRFRAPPATLLSIQGQSSTTAVDVDLFSSRTLVVGVKALDGGPMRYLPLPVEVPAHRVETSVGEPEAADDGTFTIPFDIHVTDERGEGVDGLAFQVGEVSAPSKRLVTSTVAPNLLAPCHCAMPVAATPARPLGDGRYRWTLTATSADGLPSTVRFFSPEGDRAVEAPLPPGIATQVDSGLDAPRRTRGFFAAVHAGTWLGTVEDPVFQLAAELGGRIGLHRRLALDLSAQGRWFRRRDRGSDVDVFPLTGRLALSYTAWTPDFYIGGGAGARVGDLETRPVGEVFVGALVPMAMIDLDIEAGYTAAGSGDAIDEVAGWGLRVGLRWNIGQ